MSLETHKTSGGYRETCTSHFIGNTFMFDTATDTMGYALCTISVCNVVLKDTN